MSTDLKNVVRQNRRLSGLSQIQLAKLAGVGKTVIFDIEHGKESIQFDTLKKVLAVLNIKLILQNPAMERSEKKQVKPASSK
jgi:HTH-type transcriptional regulator / antitoxin HipB